jgi:hypothetical protein
MIDDKPHKSLNTDDRASPKDESSGVNFALIDSMGGHEFEDVVENLLSKMGFHIEGRQAAADGGIDMIASKEDAIVGGKYIIQCKRYSGSVGNAVIRDLYGVVHSESANKGVLITNSTFTREARRFAEGKPIELIDGAKLQELLLQYGLLTSNNSSRQARLSPGLQLLYTQLVRPLSRIIEESQQISRGLAFLSKEEVNDDRYHKIYQRHMSQITGFVNTLTVISNHLPPLLSNYNPSPEDLTFLRNLIKEILKVARALLKIQKEAESIVPSSFSFYPRPKVHPLYVKIAPAFLLKLWAFAQLVQDLVEGESSRSNVNLMIDLNIPEIDYYNDEVERVAELDRSQGKTSGACFIATAAYATDMEPRVIELRNFRDNFLVRYAFGIALVSFYEQVSPSIANIIEKRLWLRWMTQKLLLPVIILATLINKFRVQKPPILGKRSDYRSGNSGAFIRKT